MQGYLLSRDDLSGLVREMMKTYKVVAPVKKETRFDFSEIEKFEDIRLDYDTTILPPKKFIIPPVETLLKFKRSENKAEPVFDTTPMVLFGLHPCDIKAIKHLDQAFKEN
ncbi:MAG: 4Fe-4S ferredoxin, partial [Myxococcota bacterium]